VERLCFFINLVPGTEAEYERRHDEIWPEMRDAVSAAGYTNYTLFRRGTTVIGYAECQPDVASVGAAMGGAEIAAKWNESFIGIIDSMTDANGDILRADEVWHLA
jgi:L-rhamnose mutarotase